MGFGLIDWKMSTGILLCAIVAFGLTGALELRNGAYEDLVIRVSDNVPQNECTTILTNIESTLTSASQYLFSALDSRAFLRSATVLLPSNWPDSCVASAVLSSSGEVPDVTVLPSDPARGGAWTQQSLGCGQPGDQIYLGFEELLRNDNNLGRKFVKEFAKYRYGVFDEEGYNNDPIYPMCYHDDQSRQEKVTGCSDLPLIDNGICSDKHAEYNLTKIVDEKARSSIMFTPIIPSISMFCDEGNHNRMAPTKHNFFCERRSVLDVIINHKDFSKNPQNTLAGNQITDTTPRIVYKKQNITRYVFVIENSKDMMLRESWSYLRLALRQWAGYVLPDSTEIGMVLSDPTQSTRALNIVPVKANGYDRFGINNRDKFYSAIPYTTSESLQKVCLHCAVTEAMNMLKEKNKTDGPANNVIVVIGTGMTVDNHMKTTIDALKKSKIKVATVNYPDINRANTLSLLASETGGADYTVFEQKLNVDTTLLTTYFELRNVLYDIVMKFSSKNQIDLPIEIHRKAITDDGRSSITGSFMLDPNMGEPAQFTFYTHNTITPLIKGLKLISPSHQIFSSRNDRLIDFKMITLNANISETGTWTYVVEPYPGNPQPHFIQVMATPRSLLSPVVRADFKIRRNTPTGPFLLLAEVKYGDLPILGAKVEITVTKPGANGSLPLRTKIELLDTGSGDPDITKGDGIYTKYFSAAEWGPGLYNFEVKASDNGNTAYTWSDNFKGNGAPCCGSAITSNGVQPLAPFQRVLPKRTIIISSEDISTANDFVVGRIGDLKAKILADELKARLSWTSPDMGGDSVSHYEIRYADSVFDILDNFETKARLWDYGQPFPLSPGSETSFTLDFNQKKELLDHTLYFAIKSYSKNTNSISGPISNWVRVLVNSPPPPPTVPPTYSSNDQSYWPNHGNSFDNEVAGPSISKSMPLSSNVIIAIGVVGTIIVLLIILSILYFVCKRKHVDNAKSLKDNAIKKDNLSTTVTIVPSSPQHNNSNNSTQTYVGQDMPDPHQIGVPINNYGYEDDTKKRYSLVHQQEQQLIEELKHHHQQRDNYEGVSVISNHSINRNQVLSPYNSWTASQLLHEHERRRSPMEGNMPGQEQMMCHQGLLINGDADHMGPMTDAYGQTHMPPPVPPLPVFSDSRYPPNYEVYECHPQAVQHVHPIYQSMQRREPFNQSLQGSLSSVNSGEKKKRNVTMV
ncbi:unnamed protein product [Phyllotreta striolata]|uniref:Calcium-activated chloride channel N-terminal domain-containing protein n=1 Tax=Phyllotreta striolata TaxID=444603 RepID=A0A9N9XQS4_PHYSR|nr:unnamed protein product [Phyllotreta striolata]